MTSQQNSNEPREPALIYRFVPTETEPRLPDNAVSRYDPLHNILRIDSARFELLTDDQRATVMRSLSNVDVEEVVKPRHILAQEVKPTIRRPGAYTDDDDPE